LALDSGSVSERRTRPRQRRSSSTSDLAQTGSPRTTSVTPRARTKAIVQTRKLSRRESRRSPDT
jgi:hypothetical protein